jgi:triphosphoribosyl-dephospho-CoA synthase
MDERDDRTANDIMKAAQLAAALEVSGYPKPGNVHRTADFPDTTFEQFIAGAIALGPAIKNAALKGIMAGRQDVPLHQIGVGKYVKQAVLDVNSWHHGGNTHLGISLLFAPLAAAAGLTSTAREMIAVEALRGDVRRVMEATTAQDAADAYDAIRAASSAALGHVNGREAPDLADAKAREKIVQRRLSLYDVMKTAASWDNIAYEWATGMEITFETGYTAFMANFRATRNVNLATTHTLLSILAKYPDTFIARKIGVKNTAEIRDAVQVGLVHAREVSERAATILQLGGLGTPEGTQALNAFDRELRSHGNELNPGTSADLTAASLMIAVLSGFRP